MARLFRVRIRAERLVKAEDAKEAGLAVLKDIGIDWNFDQDIHHQVEVIREQDDESQRLRMVGIGERG